MNGFKFGSAPKTAKFRLELELLDGTKYPITMHGKSELPMSELVGNITDYVDVCIPANTEFYINTIRIDDETN
jgi:Uma2 family endonuclease